MPKWLAFCLLANLLWGVWGIVPYEKPAEMSDEMMLVVSTIGLLPVALLLLAWPSVRRGQRSFRGLSFALITGIFASLGNYCILRALAMGGDAAAVYPITGLFPLVTLVLALLFLNERPNLAQMLGIVLAIIAILLFSGSTTMGENAFIVGNWLILSLIAATLFGVVGITQKLSMNAITPDLGTVCFVIGFLPVALGMVTLDPRVDWQLSPKGWAVGLLWGILAGSAMLAQLAAYRTGKASVVTAVAALYPAVTVLLAVAFYDEKLSIIRSVALVLALLAGAALAQENNNGVVSLESNASHSSEAT